MKKWMKVIGSLIVAAMVVTVFAGVALAQGPNDDSVRDEAGRPAWAGSGKRAVERQATVTQNGRGQGNSESGQGRGGYGQENALDGTSERRYVNNETSPQEWLEYKGTVVQTQADGVDLVIQTSDGQEVKVGTGPEWMAAQGFTLQAGDLVQVRGYWEDDELKASQITRLTDGQTITLRDEAGRPAWAGSGKRAVERQATVTQNGRGQGQGNR